MSKGTQLLGTKISLISKSEIRYEGILFSLDPHESTLALAKGKPLYLCADYVVYYYQLLLMTT